MTAVTIKYLQISKNWLENNFNWKSADFYCNPRIHKSKEIEPAIKNSNEDYIEIYRPNLKGSPVVADRESPTQRLGYLLKLLLKPIAPELTTYMKDDWNFLRFSPSEIDSECDLYSCNIESQYTCGFITCELRVTSCELVFKKIKVRFTS